MLLRKCYKHDEVHPQHRPARTQSHLLTLPRSIATMKSVVFVAATLYFAGLTAAWSHSLEHSWCNNGWSDDGTCKINKMYCFCVRRKSKFPLRSLDNTHHAIVLKLETRTFRERKAFGPDQEQG
ncbi:hypothetical protein EJ03DRAFT_99135 [Teratosphaeria nubilosa]|uniref:Uncharacterized protein n=1 Tax=Teratosphaeria nubilosa TaxID=161662 RepID=A0A6G1LAA4_9PEZI|nr:hypothetical protein EJ03DRAFT_99135 [Teratosphaeria nubilosa]